MFLTLLFGILFLAGSRPMSVEAANTKKCKVVFTKFQWCSFNDTFRKWYKTVDKGSYIELPKVTRSGYKCVWVEKNGKQRIEVFCWKTR